MSPERGHIVDLTREKEDITTAAYAIKSVSIHSSLRSVLKGFAWSYCERNLTNFWKMCFSKNTANPFQRYQNLGHSESLANAIY